MKELEIEIKAYCKDLDQVRQTLGMLGAVYIKTERESDRYFNHPARDFKQTDEALRLRSVGNRTIMTYKGPKISQKSKARIEKEVVVHGEAESAEILGLLGFHESGFVVKTRDYYTLSHITICLDQVEGLGLFVELEKKGESLDLIEKELFTLAETLGLDRFERKSYLELILE
ncbi:MAG: class IV adenylate cyclase [Proteobacteria bacterium]|nr:class IV adenylate cyclase [Pseudomonadota bacterium]